MRVLLVAYNNDSYIHYFPLGLAYVAASLEKQCHDVHVWQQDKWHSPDTAFTNYLLHELPIDIVGIGMCAGYYQYRRLLGLCDVVHKAGNYKLWLGGHMVAAAPDYFKKITGADYICQGEYDYRENVDDYPYPAWHLFDINYYSLIRLPHAANSDRCFPVLSGRGCPFHCNFCYRMLEGYRSRSIESIVAEIKKLIELYQISYVDFADELLMVGEDRPVKIAEALKPLGIKWMCNGRLNYAKPPVLKAMREAGCQFINYGIESVNDTVLENMNKKLTRKQIIAGVEATLESGISPGLNLIWGNLGDTKETLWESVQFLKKYDDQAQLRTIRPVTPYPGCDLYQHAIKTGKLKDAADFYENKHVNSDLLSVNFTNLTDDEFHRALYKANSMLICHYYNKQRLAAMKTAKKLYYQRDASFRGFRQT